MQGDSLRTALVAAAQVRLRAIEGSPELGAEIAGVAHERVHLQRCFPLSEPRRYVAILDREAAEIAILDDVDGLDATSKAVAEAALDRRYFTPKIERIRTLKNEAGMWRFEVETQRGASEFFVRNWRDSAVELSAGRWQILSVDGGRYEIPRLEDLDDGSLRLLEQLL